MKKIIYISIVKFAASLIRCLADNKKIIYYDNHEICIAQLHIRSFADNQKITYYDYHDMIYYNNQSKII